MLNIHLAKIVFRSTSFLYTITNNYPHTKDNNKLSSPRPTPPKPALKNAGSSLKTQTHSEDVS